MVRYSKIVVSVLSVSLIASSLGGCFGGRAANPVATYQPTDEGLTCSSLLMAMGECQQGVDRLIPETQKTGKNVALGVAGLIVWPAWLFMDFSNAEKAEVQAYRARYNHLARIYNDKQCNNQGQKVEVAEMPDYLKQAEEANNTKQEKKSS